MSTFIMTFIYQNDSTVVEHKYRTHDAGDAKQKLHNFWDLIDAYSTAEPIENATEDDE